MAPPKPVSLTPIPISWPEPLSSLRLMTRPQRLELLGACTASSDGKSTTRWWSVPAEGDTPSVLLQRSQLLPPPPGWEALCLADGSTLLVAEVAEGAVNSLSLLGTGRAPSALSAKHRTRSFVRPRFRRLAGAGLPDAKAAPLVTATSVERKWVIFRPAGARHDELITVGPAVDGVLIESEATPMYTAVVKREVPGPVRSDGAVRGQLHHLTLSQQLVPTTDVPLEEGPFVYELDAAVHDGTLYVVATRERGAVLIVTDFPTRALPPRIHPIESVAVLSSPSIAFFSGQVHLAFLQAPGAEPVWGQSPLAEQGRP